MLCESILKVNKKICFAAIINEKGRALQSKDRMGIIRCMPITKQDMFFMEYSLRQNMRKEFDDEFGSVKYTYAEREKEILFTFPLDNHLIIVACKIGINPVSFSRKIISIIDEVKIKLDLKKNMDEMPGKIIMAADM
jgi:Family of unknown function (DUF6659)